MKDLPEFKDISDEEDRKAAYEKFIKRQQVRPFLPLLLHFVRANEV